MVSIIQRAQRVGRKAHASINSVVIAYLPVGESGLIQLAATPGFRRSEETLSSGVVVDRQLADFICELSELPRFPKRGDTIFYDNRVFVVQHPGGGREADWHDQYNESVRIHTVETVSTAAAQVPNRVYGSSTGPAYGTSNNQAYGRP